MVQQVAGQCVALFALKMKRQLQNLDQVSTIWQDLVAIYPSYLRETQQSSTLAVQEIIGDLSLVRGSSQSPRTTVGDSTVTLCQVLLHSKFPHLSEKKEVCIRKLKLNGKNMLKKCL